MHVPPHTDVSEYAEMVLCLPPTWKVSDEESTSDDEENYWPIHWMKMLARLPHEI